MDSFGNAYVTDTWNQRVQLFVPDPSGTAYTASTEWPVSGWNDQSPQNKPFLTLDSQSNVYVTDPEACRVIEFSPAGQAVHVFDGCSASSFLLPSGIAWDGSGGLWLTDASSNRLVHIPSTP